MPRPSRTPPDTYDKYARSLRELSQTLRAPRAEEWVSIRTRSVPRRFRCGLEFTRQPRMIDVGLMQPLDIASLYGDRELIIESSTIHADAD